MSTVETTDGTRESRVASTRDASKNTAATASGTASNYLTRLVAFLAVLGADFADLVGYYAGQAELAGSIREAFTATVGDAVTDAAAESHTTQAFFVNMIRRLAAAAIAFVVVVLLMVQLWTMDMVANADGPFSGLLDDIQTVLMGAFGLIALGLFAYAANAAMSALNFGGGNGGR